MVVLIRHNKEESMGKNLTEDEAVQSLKGRLKVLKPGDKVVVKIEEDGLSVHSEFQEIRSEAIKATVEHK